MFFECCAREPRVIYTAISVIRANARIRALRLFCGVSVLLGYWETGEAVREIKQFAGIFMRTDDCFFRTFIRYIIDALNCHFYTNEKKNTYWRMEDAKRVNSDDFPDEKNRKTMLFAFMRVTKNKFIVNIFPCTYAFDRRKIKHSRNPSCIIFTCHTSKFEARYSSPVFSPSSELCNI